MVRVGFAYRGWVDLGKSWLKAITAPCLQHASRALHGSWLWRAWRPHDIRAVVHSTARSISSSVQQQQQAAMQGWWPAKQWRNNATDQWCGVAVPAMLLMLAASSRDAMPNLTSATYGLPLVRFYAPDVAVCLSVCVSVVHVDVLCPNDLVDHYATFARL